MTIYYNSKVSGTIAFYSIENQKNTLSTNFAHGSNQKLCN